MIDTIIFDLNNVAENYEKFKYELNDHIESVLVKACKLLNSKYNREKLLDLFRNRLSIIDTVPFQHHPAFWQSLFEEYLKKNLTYEEIDNIYDIYLSQYSDNITCYSDFIESVGICKDRKLKLGIVANGNAKRIYKFLEKYQLIDKFDSIIASGSTPFSKPKSEIFDLSLYNLKSLLTRLKTSMTRKVQDIDDP